MRPPAAINSTSCPCTKVLCHKYGTFTTGEDHDVFIIKYDTYNGFVLKQISRTLYMEKNEVGVVIYQLHLAASFQSSHSYTQVDNVRFSANCE